MNEQKKDPRVEALMGLRKFIEESLFEKMKSKMDASKAGASEGVELEIETADDIEEGDEEEKMDQAKASPRPSEFEFNLDNVKLLDPTKRKEERETQGGSQSLSAETVKRRKMK